MIYDTFIFYDELDLLEIRLSELNNTVDKFVLVEAERTHQNKPKPLYYAENKELFAKYNDKIIHIVVPSAEFNDHTWHNENHQIRCISRGLTNTSAHDIILIGYVDEIPNTQVLVPLLRDFKDYNFLYLKMFYMYFDTVWKLPHGEDIWWKGNVITRQQNITDTYQMLRSRENLQNSIMDGGWHFSFMGGVDRIDRKIHNYAHSEFNFITKENITSFYENLTDPLGRSPDQGCVFDSFEDINKLPKTITTNLSKYKKYFYKNYEQNI